MLLAVRVGVGAQALRLVDLQDLFQEVPQDQRLRRSQLLAGARDPPDADHAQHERAGDPKGPCVVAEKLLHHPEREREEQPGDDRDVAERDRRPHRGLGPDQAVHDAAALDFGVLLDLQAQRWRPQMLVRFQNAQIDDPLLGGDVATAGCAFLTETQFDPADHLVRIDRNVPREARAQARLTQGGGRIGSGGGPA